MSSKQAPSAGAKVHLGSSAPTTREGAGAVAADSLAAESVSAGGGFAANRHAQVGDGGPAPPPPGKVSAPGEGGGGGGGGALENQASYGGAAPSYVENVYREGAGGPKGKGLTEVESFEGGARPGNSIEAEPGSRQDPGRAAERAFGLGKEADAPGTDGGGARVAEETRFAALDSETSA